LKYYNNKIVVITEPKRSPNEVLVVSGVGL
jgi:hypothetical protein